MEIIGTTRDILNEKGRQVWTITPDTLVFDAVKLMGEKNVGALVAMDGGQVVGVISERDYSRKVVLRGRTSQTTYVREILSQPVISVTPAHRIEECMELMTEHRVRHLPVLEDGGLAGIISIGDLVNWIIHAQRHAIDQLQGYIRGQYPA